MQEPGRTGTAALSAAVAALRAGPHPSGLPAAALDPDVVARAVARDVPEVAAGELRLLSVDVYGVRARRGAWHVRYTATVAGPDGTRRPLSLLGVVASEASGLADAGLSLMVEDVEARLPAVAMLRDAAAVRGVLQDGIGAGACPGIRIAAVDVRVARHVPGQRCTVLCRLGYGPGADPRWPPVVVAKAYADDQAAHTYRAMRELWDASSAAGGTLPVAEPLAHVPEHRLLLQQGLPGSRTLKDLLVSTLTSPASSAQDDVRAAVTRTAGALASLHGCAVRYGEDLRWEDALVKLRKDAGRLAGISPQVAASVTSVLDWLDRRESETAREPLRPSHGAFRPAQVLTDGATVGIVDFDGFCRSEPARDVARFRKALAKTVNVLPDDGTVDIDAVASVLRGLAEDFLVSYEREAPVSRKRVALWECVDLLKAMTHACLTGRPAAVPRLAGLLEQPLAVLR